jgi:hypothetical protein
VHDSAVASIEHHAFERDVLFREDVAREALAELADPPFEGGALFRARGEVHGEHALARRDAHPRHRVARHPVVEAIRERRFREPDQREVRALDPAAGEALADHRQERVGEHAGALARRARQARDRAAVGEVDPEPRRGAVAVREDVRAAREERLSPVARGRRGAARLEAGHDRAPDRAVLHEIDAGDRGDRIARHVVLRRAEAAGGDDEFARRQQVDEPSGDRIRRVRFDRGARDAESDHREFARDERGVEIGVRTREQFVSDGEHRDADRAHAAPSPPIAGAAVSARPCRRSASLPQKIPTS